MKEENPSDSSCLIEAKKITVKRNEKNILSEVSLKLLENDFVTIIGPNGAGKTMLLKCLMGFYSPDEGCITRKKKLRIGYIPQRLEVDHTIPISVRRFLLLRKKITEPDLLSLAKETSITSFLDTPMHVLSGGELQKVLLARVLAGTPDLLILDEPAQNLDVLGQMKFYKLLETIYAQRRLSVLMVSHDLHLVMASTKRVICLFHHVCCSGEPHAVTKEPEFIKLFGSDMAHMMSIYHHHHDHEHSLGEK